MYIDGLEKIKLDDGEPKKKKINWLKLLGVIMFFVGLTLIGASVFFEIVEVQSQITQFGFYKTDLCTSTFRFYIIPICGFCGLCFGGIGGLVFLDN